ncbi:MAG: hypothetical protein U0269_18945 [Polyangiales bacterium]
MEPRPRINGPPLRARRVAWIAIGVALSAPRLASAQSTEQARPRWQLDWVAPAQCPSEAEARAAVAAMLEGAADAQHEQTLTFRASVQNTADRWTLELVTTRPDGSDTRTLEDDRCAPLVDALALIVAITVDPTVATRVRTATPVSGGLATSAVDSSANSQRVLALAPARASTVRASTQPPRAAPTRAAASNAAPHTAARRRWTLGLGGAVDSGILPAPAWGALAWGAYTAALFRAELSVGWWPERTASVASRPAAGGAVSAYSARALGCVEPRWRMVSVAGCAAIEGAVVRGRGTGVSDPGEALSPWVALGLEARASLDLHPVFSLVIRGGANVLLTRPEFYLEGIGTFFQTPALTARGAIGAEVHF